jgi:hypothetical protein
MPEEETNLLSATKMIENEFCFEVQDNIFWNTAKKAPVHSSFEMKPDAPQTLLEESGKEELFQKWAARRQIQRSSGQRFGRWLITPSCERRIWPKGASPSSMQTPSEQ